MLPHVANTCISGKLSDFTMKGGLSSQADSMLCFQKIIMPFSIGEVHIAKRADEGLLLVFQGSSSKPVTNIFS